MKRLLAVFAAGALGVVGLAAGLAASGFAGNAREVGTDDKLTICHVAGLASDPANYITLTLPYNAVYGKNGESGHFNENGTTKAGHEQDTLGPCSPPQTDLCPNLEGVQSEVPGGMVLEDGKCAVPPPRLCPDGKPPTSGEDAYDPNDDCKRPPAPVTETTLTTTTESAPTTTPATPTTPSTPAAPFTPPTTKPVAEKPAVEKPAAKPAPATPKKAVAGALANEPPRLAYTP